MPEPLYVASPDCLARLAAFVKDLKALCDKHALDIRASDDAVGEIEVTDRLDDRGRELKYDWPNVASFTGVDRNDIYNYRNSACRRVAGLDINEYEIDEETRPDLVKAGLLPAEVKNA